MRGMNDYTIAQSIDEAQIAMHAKFSDDFGRCVGSL